jgi:outer membrane protein OmpA-like peptidoglycan-associated protein
MNLRSALLAATVLALPLAAKAQPVTGIYVGAGAGYNILQDVTVKEGNYGATSGAASYGGTLQAQGGFVGKASVGYGFGNGFRVELEGNFYSNKFNKASLYGSGTSAGGFEYKAGGLVNALYDFTTLSPYFQPYLGAGVGYEGVKWDNVRAYGVGSSAGYSVGTSSSEWKGSFAYQGIAGVAFPIAAIPGLAITAEYDFLGLAGTRNYGASYTVPKIGSTPAQSGTGIVKASNDYNHSFLVGVRYNFGVAPPPPPAPVVAPAPAPSRSYLVFFDWDKYNLTDRARAIIKEAAMNSTKVQVTRIEVNGYTDTSGTPKYNLGLSIRRADAVKAELIRNGVPASEIVTKGFGDTHLLVPTGPGVREPQNRRVEIILH